LTPWLGFTVTLRFARLHNTHTFGRKVPLHLVSSHRLLVPTRYGCVSLLRCDYIYDLKVNGWGQLKDVSRLFGLNVVDARRSLFTVEGLHTFGLVWFHPTRFTTRTVYTHTHTHTPLPHVRWVFTHVHTLPRLNLVWFLVHTPPRFTHTCHCPARFWFTRFTTRLGSRFTVYTAHTHAAHVTVYTRLHVRSRFTGTVGSHYLHLGSHTVAHTYAVYTPLTGCL